MASITEKDHFCFYLNPVIMSKDIHVCPVWVGKLMVSPLRKIYQNPKTILMPYLEQGTKVIEIGPGLGFFSLPIGKMIGAKGTLYCVDIQERMLSGLKTRVKKARLENIETILSTKDSYRLESINQKIDFALLFAVVHEVPDQIQLFGQLAATLKSRAKVLFAEPKGHVSENQFQLSVRHAEKFGLLPIKSITIRGSHTVILEKK